MNFIKKNKKSILFYGSLLISSLAIIIFTFNNQSFYKETIAKVIETSEKKINEETVNFGYQDITYRQTIKAKIENGPYKNEIITLTNEYHNGEAYGEKYRKNNEVFVSLDVNNKIITGSHITGYKRDKYIVILAVTFILSIIIVGKTKGFLSIISVIINVVIFYVIVHLNTKNISLPILSFVGSIFFSAICLTLVSGFNKKTLSAIISSILGVSATMLITMIVIHTTNYSGIRFEQMELLTRPYEGIFISELILGGLGAIMDISISMASSLNELIEKDPKIKTKQLIKSGFNIGKDIMSTMINVLFFTYICTSLGNLSIMFRNGITVNMLLTEYISLEMTRALVGAIGITITIPIAIYITVLVYRRRLKND